MTPNPTGWKSSYWPVSKIHSRSSKAKHRTKKQREDNRDTRRIVAFMQRKNNPIR